MSLQVPFFRPDLGTAEIDEVVEVLKSGWLTTGPRTREFERRFAEACGAPHAIAVNSCTAALHLAVEALGLRPGEGVLVPTMTFAATAEVVRYLGAVPILVDCDPETLLLDLDDAERKLDALASGDLPRSIPRETKVVGIIPVHVAGVMADVRAIQAFAQRHRLWIVEDAAHSFPAAWRSDPNASWQRCGEGTSAVTCFSFYANKTMTTGEGGMATTADATLAERMRLMSLHGLSKDAWDRYRGGQSWDYRIVAPGYKYNLTDVAAALGLHQLARAEAMRLGRERIARRYLEALATVPGLRLPPSPPHRLHSWHLFYLRVADGLAIPRNEVIEKLRARGIACSVHWRPLHRHPYYEEAYGWRTEHCPAASAVWERVLSLPIFSAMRDDEVDHVIDAVRGVFTDHAR